MRECDTRAMRGAEEAMRNDIAASRIDVLNAAISLMR
jgi:hypothetical protein